MATDPNWDEWFDKQLSLTDNIKKMVDIFSEGKSDMFKIAMWSAVIEDAAEEIRRHIPDNALGDKT